MAQIGETELDIHALSRALWRRAWLLVLLAVAAAVATYVGLGFVEPLYTADTSILIEERESPLTRPLEGTSAAATFDESAIQSQVEVLRSREIADAVIDRLDLTRQPELDPARQPSLVDSVLILFGLKEHPTDVTIRQRVMGRFFDRLTVYPLSKSRVIGVEFVAPDPELAADVANAVAGAFVELQQDAKRESALAATQWLEQEIERLRGRVEEAEQKVAIYRETNDLFDVDSSGSLSTQQLSDINAELARARAARAEAEARAELIQSLLVEGGALETSQEVLESQLIQRLRERQVAIRSQLAEFSTTLLPGHPRIQALHGQLSNMEAQIRQEAAKVRASLETAARVAAAREQSLVASLDEAKAAVSRANGQEIELRALEREATAQRELLESFLARYREALARTDADYLPADARVISRAVAPQEPSYPKRAMMSVAAAIAMLLVASAVLTLREFTSGRAFRIIDYGAPAGAERPLRGNLFGAPRLDHERDPEAIAPPRRRINSWQADETPEPEPQAAFSDATEARRGEMPEVVATRADDEEEPAASAVEAEEAKAWAEAPEAEEARAAAEREADISHRRAEAEAERAAAEAEEAAIFADRMREADIVVAREPEAETVVVAGPEEAEAIVVDAQEGPYEGDAGEEQAGAAAAPFVDTAGATPAIRVEAEEAARLEYAESEDEPEPSPLGIEGDRPGSAQIAEIIASPAVRLVLFAGAEGGEGAGDIAFAAARHVAREKLRVIIVDVGMTPSQALGGNESPGLGDLIAGEAAFGEVIRRDEATGVHVIPMGATETNPPLQRLQLVVGALSHTYDKVLIVADSLDDWPDEHAKPDLAAIVCGPETTEILRGELYDLVLARGAHSALIVRYAGDQDDGAGPRESAAA